MSRPYQTPLSRRSLLTREQFEASYASEYYGEKGGEFLASKGIFDQPGESLGYASRQLPLLNILGLYSHFSGTLYAGATNFQGSSTRFDADLGKKGKHIPELLSLFKEELGIAFHGKAEEYRFGKNGKIYARLLHAIGFSASMPLEREQTQNENTKTERNAQLPPYLLTLEEEYKTLGKEDQKLARRYLRDVVAVFFDSCRKEYEKKDSNSVLFLKVMSKRTSELVKEEASTLIRFMNCAYAGLEASVEKNFFPITPDEKRPYYQGTNSFHLG